MTLVLVIVALTVLGCRRGDNPRRNAFLAADHEGTRVQLEEQILSTTVCICYESWLVADDESGYTIFRSVGLGTVKNDRYLVTHNHVAIPLSILPRAGEPDVYSRILLSDASGVERYSGPLTDFTVVAAEADTLILAHREPGFFTSLGFSSAEFSDWKTLSLAPGMEVAQVDWDGKIARVDWVHICDLDGTDDYARLELEDGTMVGASGGGVFWHGYHIGHNWRLDLGLDCQGNVVLQRTAVALNSATVTGNLSMP